MRWKSFRFLIFAFIWIMISSLKNIASSNTLSSTTTLYVDPHESYGTIAQNFTVNISVSDVADLYGWEFRLGWDNTVLDTVEVLEGPFLKSAGNTFFTYKINNTLGYMIVDCTLLGNVPGVSGSGILATIKFYVKTVGECLLDLYDTILVNSAEQAIEHTEVDGYYYTSVHDIAIIGLTATSTEVNITVENQGTFTETFNVSAYYTRLSDPLIGTQTVTLAKGAKAIVTFTWSAPSPGRYEIRAEASIISEETDVADNVYTLIIQAGYGTSTSAKENRTANQINGFYQATCLFLLVSAMIALKIFYNIKKTHKIENFILSNDSSLEDFEMNFWKYLTLKQLNSLR